MIPQELVLTNFMCYRKARLDFSGIHIACLCGDNGAGKSALLDALTWTLWGRSRARRDDELIHLGQTEMMVEFTFRLEEQTYRVLRRRKAGKRGSTLLDFQVKAPDDAPEGRWRSIAESTIRRTQQKIEHVLRLDYDTFVNSAFLRQGRADEFTIKTASERKRVLSEILGLDRWSSYEERAKERLREIRAESDAVALRLQEIEAELSRRPAYEAELETAQAAVQERSAELKAAQEAHRTIEAARTELRHAEARRAESVERLNGWERDLAALEEERAAHRHRLAEYEQLLTDAQEIEAGYAAYQQAVAREQELAARLQQSQALNERRQALEARLSEARHRLEAEREMLLHRIAELEARRLSEALIGEHQEVQARLTHLTQLAASREAARDDLARLSEEQAMRRAQNEALRSEMHTIKEKIAQLEQAAAECPLCQQPLTEEHRLQLLEQFRQEGRARGDTYRENQAVIEELIARSQALTAQIAQTEHLLREQPALQRREAALAERIEQGRQAEAALDEAHANLEALERRLADKDYAPEVQAELAEVLRAAEELGYDRAAHEAARQAMAQGQVYAERHARLAVAQTGRDEAQAALARVAESERHLREQIAAERAGLAEIEQTIAALQAQLEAAADVESRLNQARQAEATARQRLGAAQQRLEACRILEQQQTDKRRRQDELAAERRIYEELQTAFGVKGVPAMIIEAAVPEIEAEANRILARMTDGRMHVRFETQKETRSGKLQEVLELYIADELGTREYSLYSGGEAFRVNFAIRIALAKLLARRAGAQLQTLIVDEGFGTQDTQGRERLVEALNAVQDEFACVLVITHIDELKDAFPVRIQITKTADGSGIAVV